MFTLSYFQLDLLGVCAALLICFMYCTRRDARPPFPPGPKPLPVIGNILHLPREKPWETYCNWAKEYGDVVHLSYLGKSIIVLNSFKAAYDLLERKSSIYSSRPHLTMVSELMDLGRTTTSFQRYGSFWRKHRTLYHKYMSQIAVREFQSSQMVAAKGLLRLLLESPQDYLQHIRHMTASVVMSIAYGNEVLPQSDPYVALAERNIHVFSRALRPGAFLVDTFPLLKHVPEWVPGAGFQKLARETRESVNQARDLPFRDVKARLVTGTARPSFVANALTELGNDDESNEDVEAIKGVAGGIFGAGSDTTTSALHSFMLAMTLYPEVQKKAQAELDNIIGHGRLPQFNDRHHLPYINAVVKEVYRWIPVLPTALPHVATEDDIYEGYHIPANSVVVANSWNILHDPKMYPEPWVFRPERFLPDHKKEIQRDPGSGGAFGYGRRICAGRHLADAAVWMAVASVLSVFNITRAVDECGHPIDVRYACEPETNGAIVHPRPFPCSIIPRSREAEAMIRSME